MAHRSSCELIVHSFPLCVQWYQIGSSKSATIRVFAPQKSANTTNEGSPTCPIVDCYNFSAHHLQWPSVTETRLKNVCWNWGSFGIERDLYLPLQEIHQFNLRLCHDCGILRSTVNYGSWLSLQAVKHNEQFCFPIIWLPGWSFSENYRSMPSFELLREGSHSPRESVL